MDSWIDTWLDDTWNDSSTSSLHNKQKWFL